MTYNNNTDKSFSLYSNRHFKEINVSVRKNTNCFGESELSALSNLSFYSAQLANRGWKARGSLKHKIDRWANQVNAFFDGVEVGV